MQSDSFANGVKRGRTSCFRALPEDTGLRTLSSLVGEERRFIEENVIQVENGMGMESIKSQLFLLFLGCFSLSPACTTCQTTKLVKAISAKVKERPENFPR